MAIAFYRMLDTESGHPTNKEIPEVAVFRARARAVDMLGRQQIAGIPTAISELFKNAHDAYADNVDVDFYRSDGLFVLRDNGVGMSLEEFEERWLVLGTESKLAARTGLKPPPVDPSKPKRPVLGEKGIGRLAIAAIGPQVLVLSRSKWSKAKAPIFGAFINWGMFRLPGVDLGQIAIPTRTFPSAHLPSAKQIHEMVDEVRANLRALKQFADPEQLTTIGNQLDAFDINPHELSKHLGKPSLLDDGHGTHFYIQPSDESLVPAIDGQERDDDVAPPLLKALVGFTNTMTPGYAAPVILAAFRDHKTEDFAEELIGDTEFFSPAEFREADHHIEGRFDEFGQFAGTVTVYGEPTAGHIVPWQAGGRPTECGPFRINLAVVQGAARESTMPMEEWLRVTRKLGKYGGLYIYRDGIRVLPYGNNDYDFIDIERNRTKSAAYYYFSYRRIFGVIEIDRESNPSLQEKAGREGFRENKAYRQFREILKNFFVQIAADFFREGGARAHHFVDRRAELDRVERARREREKQVTARRTAFRDKMEAVFSAIESGAVAKDISAVLEDVKREATVAVATRDPAKASSALVELETSSRARLADVRERYRVVPPRGVGLARAVRRDYEAYRSEFDRLDSTLFEPAVREAESLIMSTATNAKILVDRRVRFERALSAIASQARKTSQTESNQVRSSVMEVQERAAALVRESVSELDAVVKRVLSRAARIDVSQLDDEGFVSERRALETEVETAAAREHRSLGSIVAQLRGISWPSSEDGEIVTSLDVAEAVDEELLALRERSEADLELAQLGMAIQVISHEFDATIKGVRRGLRELRAWADANEDLEGVYTNIRRSFEHLDGYLTLFTPLQRRMYRKPIRIAGGDVAKFLTDLFEERLSRHEVTLQSTSRFKRFGFTGYPSTFYPVFVNLIDNAIFWLNRSKKPRGIRLDLDEDGMTVANSGPPISARDRDAIFELGFTRKPGGRGLGLHISREVLAKEGYALELKESTSEFGVTFSIKKAEPSPKHRGATKQAAGSKG